MWNKRIGACWRVTLLTRATVTREYLARRDDILRSCVQEFGYLDTEASFYMLQHRHRSLGVRLCHMCDMARATCSSPSPVSVSILPQNICVGPSITRTITMTRSAECPQNQLIPRFTPKTNQGWFVGSSHLTEPRGRVNDVHETHQAKKKLNLASTLHCTSNNCSPRITRVVSSCLKVSCQYIQSHSLSFFHWNE